MSEFILIIRRDYKTKDIQLSTRELQLHLEEWRIWLKELGKSAMLINPVQQLDREGRILKYDSEVCNGPYIEVKESMGGILFLKAANYQQAVEIAKGCPILDIGGNVEIREGI